MGGRAEGLECTDPGSEDPHRRERNFSNETCRDPKNGIGINTSSSIGRHPMGAVDTLVQEFGQSCDQNS